jgi:epoxyqueuosine reductase QueG
MNLRDHPAVKRYFAHKRGSAAVEPARQLDSAWVRQVVLDAGADDAGLASIDSPVLAEYRSKFLTIFPEARTCISVICRMNPENVRSPFRQQYELEYHNMFMEADDVARRAAARFAQEGIRAVDCASSYPMNMENFPNMDMWYIHHKPVAVATGKGRMGLHHLVVHERFGSMIALSSILLDREVTEYGRPLDYDPCCKCMLCVTVCPVGAINADGHINAMACYTHSYRDKYGGFVDWVENVVQSRTVREYRRKHSDAETVLMWQSLFAGVSYKCTNCMAVCPGGDEHIGPYAEDQKRYRDEVARKLQDRKETVYVVKGSDAEAHVLRRFPHKPIKYVHSCARPTTAASFFANLPIVFEREQSKGLSAVYHVTFTGTETCQGTIAIRDKTIAVSDGLIGTPDMRITADTDTWLKILRGEKNFLVALLTRKVRVHGPKRLLDAFVRCFPA